MLLCSVSVLLMFPLCIRTLPLYSVRALSLPPNRPYECPIDLLPGASLPMTSRMLALAKTHFWLPTTNPDVKAYVVACPTCARNKTATSNVLVSCNHFLHPVAPGLTSCFSTQICLLECIMLTNRPPTTHPADQQSPCLHR